jgi:hypothetical protein
MFQEAEEKRLWFWSRYQDLWFSPAELRAQHQRGSFRWGHENWKLRDPTELLADLSAKQVALSVEIRRLEFRMAANR